MIMTTLLKKMFSLMEILLAFNTQLLCFCTALFHKHGVVPVSATGRAREYTNCDEVSTFSVSLLSLLDQYLRRACKRHPHAKNEHGLSRIFGGLNIVFLWRFLATTTSSSSFFLFALNNKTLPEAQRTQALLLELELCTNLVTRWWRHLLGKFGTNAGSAT